MSANAPEENPYVSPVHSAGAGDPRKADAPRLRVWAILAGWGADVGSSIVAGIVLMVIAISQLVVTGVPPERWQSELNEIPWFLIAGTAIGAGGTAFGGYLAALLGKDLPLRHAFYVGIVSLVLGAALALLLPETQPLWVTLVSLVLTLPAALLGGYLRLGQTEKKNLRAAKMSSPDS